MTLIAVDDRRDGPDDRREMPREEVGRRSTDRRKHAKVRCPHCGCGMTSVCSDWDKRAYYDEYHCAYVRTRRCDQCRGVFETGESVIGQQNNNIK